MLVKGNRLVRTASLVECHTQAVHAVEGIHGLRTEMDPGEFERPAEILLGGLDRARSEFAARPDQAEKLLTVGESKRDGSLDPAEHAAWTALCLAVFNLDEALTKE